MIAHQQRCASPAGDALYGSKETGLRLEPAFAASKTSTAAFRLRRSAPEVHGRWAVIHERLRPWRAVPRLADSKISTVELVPVEFFDRLGDRRGIRELDEGKSTRSIGDAVYREKDFLDLTHLCEQCLKVCL